MLKRKAFLISSIEEYGKFISYCIENDISVWRTYWDEREKEKRCYFIDWAERRCYYSRLDFYIENDYLVYRADFVLDEYGKYKLIAKALL